MQKYMYKYELTTSRLSSPTFKAVDSAKIYDFLKKEVFKDCSLYVREYGWAVYLDAACRIKGYQKIGEGGLDQVIFDTRIIFKGAIDCLAYALVLVHNHPSDNLKPSSEDYKITEKIVQAGKLLDIHIYDHIIVSYNGYYSFADHKVMDY